MPSGVAFVMMFAVTAATAVMAWTQDAEILAAFALIGGFTTPLLLSTGQNREVALFAYVAILDAGRACAGDPETLAAPAALELRRNVVALRRLVLEFLRRQPSSV